MIKMRSKSIVIRFIGFHLIGLNKPNTESKLAENLVQIVWAKTKEKKEKNLEEKKKINTNGKYLGNF